MTELPDLDTWIAGRPEPSGLRDETSLHDPNDGRPLQRSRSSSPDQVERAVAAADQAHRSGVWSGLGAEGRAAHLRDFADALDEHAPRIAVLDALNSGVPVSTTRLFAGTLADTVRRAVTLAGTLGETRRLPAEQGEVRLRRVPWGPTALVLPWNAPAAIATKKTAYALAAGAPVVLKPSPASPWSAQLVMAAASANLPPGTVSLVLGGADVGARLCADPRIRAISMTGSTAAGRLIAASAAPHFTRLHLELGSNNPAVVRADAAAGRTAQALFDGMTKLNGQWCEAPRNVYVARERAGDLVAALRELTREARTGSSLAERTRIGPMAFRARRDELSAQRSAWARAGHEVFSGPEVPDGGWFFAPTVVVGEDVRTGGEVFGPMLTVCPVDTEDEAVRRANASAGGLAAYVFGEDVDAAFPLAERLTGGEVKINGTSLLDMSEESAQSFFGTSGIGGHGDPDVLAFHSGRQVVGRDLVGAPL